MKLYHFRIHYDDNNPDVSIWQAVRPFYHNEGDGEWIEAPERIAVYFRDPMLAQFERKHGEPLHCAIELKTGIKLVPRAGATC